MKLVKNLTLVFILAGFTFLMTSRNSIVAGTVDSASLDPSTVTMTYGSTQGTSLSFWAENDRAFTIKTYHAEFKYTTGLNISSTLYTSPPAKTAQIDTRKQLITFEWTNVSPGTIISANITVSATSMEVGTYSITPSKIYYTDSSRNTYNAACNTTQINIQKDQIVPATPQNLRVESETGALVLYWDPVSESDLAGYNIYRRTPGSAFEKLYTLGRYNTTEHHDYTAQNGTGYYYTVTAVDASGNESSPSVETGDTYYEDITTKTIAAANASNAAGGDINHDGIPDVAIGYPKYSSGSGKSTKTNVGKVEIYYGGNTSGAPDVILAGEYGGDEFGTALAVGDFNNDAYDDLVIGAAYYTPPDAVLGDNERGKIYVYAGGPTFNSTPVFTKVGAQTDTWTAEHFGFAIAKAGDVNGDGYQDVVIGAPYGGTDRCGKIYIIYGNYSLGSLGNNSYSCSTSWQQIGTSVASAGDVNNDGYGDVIAGGPGQSSYNFIGQAHLYTGGSSLRKAFIFSTDVEKDNFGQTVSSAGDLNADGYSDIAVKGKSTDPIQVYYGGTTLSNEPGMFLYQSTTGLQSIDDLNGDGSRELITDGPTIYFSNTIGDNLADIARSNGRTMRAAADMDGNGSMDLIESSTSSVYVSPLGSYVTELPDIQLQYPHDHENTKNQNITVKGSIRGTASRISVKGQIVPLQSDGTFTADVALTLGDNILEVLAETPEGKIGKRRVTVNYGQPDPLLIEITSPSDNTVVNASPVTVTGTVSDSTANVSVNGVQASVSGNTFTASGITLTEGANTITATAKDSYGQTASKSISLTLTTKGSVTGTITDSSAGLPLAGVTVTITDSSGSHTGASDSSGMYNLSDIAAGDFTATFEKSGYIKQTTTGSLVAGQTVTLDVPLSPTPALAIAITSPADGATLSSSSLTVTGTVTNNPTVTVNGFQATVNSGVFSATIPLQEGQNTITASATDEYGQSASRSITVALSGRLDSQEIFTESQSLDFGEVTIDYYSTKSITVSNIGSGSLLIDSVGTPAAPFSILYDNCSGKALTASGSCSITIKLSPVEEGNFSGAFTITSNDADNPNLTITLSGSGTMLTGGYYLPDTGQTKCFNSSGGEIWCSYPGEYSAQDGTYLMNPLSYSINGDGTVTDSNTGLIWQQQDDAIKRTWADAGTYCADLTAGGFSDWRLPEKHELTTILDYDGSQPFIDTVSFLNAKSDNYWSSLSYVEDAWVVGFDNGSVSHISQTSTAYARCVRGNTLANVAWIDNSDSTLTDLATGLMWSQYEFASTMDWSSALKVCENGSYAGYDDWRLPNIKELASSDANCYSWSSTTSVADPAQAYTMDSCFGTISSAPKSSTDRFVRCVRDERLKTTPIAPVISSVSAGAVGTGSATIIWTTDQSSDSKVEYGTTTAYGNSATDSAMTTSHSIILSGLAQGTVYHYKVTSTNSHNLSASSGDSTFTTLAPPLISSVTVTNITSGSATVAWTTDVPANGTVEYGTTTAYGASAKDEVLTTSHSITLPNLTAETTYHYRVTSTDGNGISSSSADAAFTTKQQFTVTSLGDYGNISVMEVSGNYDANKSDGTINDYPRQEITKEFLKTHQDQYDFVVILSNFDYAMPQTEAKAFYVEVKNDIQGIGKAVFDNSAAYGSSKLQGTIDMGNINNLGFDPLDPATFEQTLDTLAHEQLHRWGAGVKFKQADGILSTALYGKDNAHWSYLFDTDGSTGYGNDWKDNGDGTFASVSASKYYSALDLYLMGMADKSQVPVMTLLENSTVDPTKTPEPGAIITATTKTVSIDDIIAAEGARVPDATTSQKAFRTAFILITQPGTFAGTETAGIETLRNAWAGRFASLTGGKASISEVTQSLTVSVVSPANASIVTGDRITVTGTVINTTGNETGITVNGIPATVYGTRFIAENVSLTEGTNTITVTATDSAGSTASTSVSLTAATTGSHITVTPIIESGVSPLTVTLRIDGTFTISNSQIFASGPGTAELQASDVDEYTAKITGDGIYVFTAKVTADDGTMYEDSASVTVLSMSDMDRQLQAKWEAMKTKLKSIDIEGAVGYFAESSQNSFREQFTLLESQLGQIVAGMRQFRMVKVRERFAEYDMRTLLNGQEYSFQILFMKDIDGIWKIRSF